VWRQASHERAASQSYAIRLPTELQPLQLFDVPQRNRNFSISGPVPQPFHQFCQASTIAVVHRHQSQAQPLARFCTSYHCIGSDLALLNEKMEFGGVSRILGFFSFNEKSIEVRIPGHGDQ
jgi:hypothetical protein